MSAATPAAGAEHEQPPARRARAGPAQRLVRALLLAGSLALVLSLLSQPGRALHSYELRALDTRLRYRSSTPSARNVAVVAIDERSLADPRLGRWPWDRRWHAQLARRLAACNPSALAFDVLFAEPSSPASDAALAAACAQSRRVFLAMHPTDLGAGSVAERGAHRFAVQPGLVRRQDLLLQLAGVAPPTAALAGSVAGAGVVAATPDADGILRRARLLVARREPAGQYLYPTLPLALAAWHQHWDYSSMRLDLGREALLSPQTRVPLDASGSALINFLGTTEGIPAYSYVDVLDGRFDDAALRGRIVLVGFTGSGLLDQYPTPLAPRLYGVEIQAQIIENLVQGLFLDGGRFSDALVLALLLSLAAAAAAVMLRPVVGLALVALLLAGYNVAALQALVQSGAVWPGLAPNLAAVLTFACLAVFRLATEEEGRRRLRSEFGRYAPPQVVARLDSGEMRVRAAGVKRQVTSLFADIRGFTAWSAGAYPHDVITVLNTYYEAMTQLAFEVEGTVDNIVGDEIFVTFNAIEDQPDHAARAVDLALNMVSALDGLNERWQALGLLAEPLRIGVGLNTGEALVGSLGSRVRTQYTALGQSVNLASRLQALTRELDTTILASAAVAEAATGRALLRSHGLREIRGHPVPVEVFEVVGRGTPGPAAPATPPPATAAPEA